jgi:cell division protein FtsW (lipid II flippase)
MVVSLFLLLFGFVMVASASLHLGDKLANDSFYFPRHQLIHIFLGLLVGCVAKRRFGWKPGAISPCNFFSSVFCY